jgi:hypothetical protein
MYYIRDEDQSGRAETISRVVRLANAEDLRGYAAREDLRKAVRATDFPQVMADLE